MTTHAPTYTPRAKYGYIVAGVQHSITFRGPRGLDAGALNIEMKALAFNLFNAFTPALADDFQWITASLALTDSDVFLPSELPNAVVGESDFTGWSGTKRIRSCGMAGRAGDSRAQIYMWGIGVNCDNAGSAGDDGILLISEAIGITAAKAELDAHARAGNGQPALWYPRMTVKNNDHLLKLVRRGSIHS